MSMVSLFQSIMTVTYIQHVHTAGKVKCFHKKSFLLENLFILLEGLFKEFFTSRWAPSFASSQFGEAVSFLAFGRNLHCYEHTGWSLRDLKPIFISIYVSLYNIYLNLWKTVSGGTCFSTALSMLASVLATGVFQWIRWFHLSASV